MTPDWDEDDSLSPGPAGRLRLRSDLVSTMRRSGPGRRWAVKDPLLLTYFDFTDEQWSLLQLFDGRRSLTEVKREFDERHRPVRVSQSELEQFANQCFRRRLLTSTSSGQAPVVREMRNQVRRDGRWRRMLSLLAIRLPGWDPDAALTILRPLGRMIFHPVFMCLAASWAAATLVMALVHARAVEQRLPEAAAHLGGQNLMLLGLAFLVVKSLHELGHALACRHVGAQCHEIGVMFFGVAPCLYCDVTDSWLTPNRGQRILVSAAGMYVELLLACAAAWLWHLSEPGAFHMLMLYVMIACGASTLLFNLNPLLRNDGYYILSDVWDAPNLHEQARQAIWRPWRKWLGIDGRPLVADLDAWRLGAFALLAGAYRVAIMGVLLMGVYRVLSAVHLRWLGDVVVVATLVGMFVVPLGAGAVTLARAAYHRRLRWLRSAVVVAALAALLTGVLTTPFPDSVSGPLIVRPAAVESVFAGVEGSLEWVASPGDVVAKGDVVARLRNAEMAAKLLQVESEAAQRRHEHLALVRLTAVDERLMDQLPAAAAARRRAERRVADLKREFEKLRVRAPSAGVVLSPPGRRTGEEAPGQLADWTGHLLDPSNQGCFVSAGELVCQIAPASGRLSAVMHVDQREAARVRLGEPLRMLLDHAPEELLKGEIASVSARQSHRQTDAIGTAAPWQIVPTAMRGDAGQSAFFEIQTEPFAAPAWVRPGSSGVAKIQTARRSAWERLLRFASRTFRIDL
ncbi:MAG TPA: hypothetical protein PKC18_03570 [Lacipirellulaceae bacterium]|nr:hypothetical protein [Lacipirellulaceae bacterium]HMP05480.1 hypothetical protein [Lacipirellulaceae bacterium]